MNKNFSEETLVTCECGDPDHSVILSHFHLAQNKGASNDPNFIWEPELYVYARMITWDSFWKRLRTAWRYLWKIDGRNHHYGETLIRREDVDKITEVLQTFAKESDKYWEDWRKECGQDNSAQ